MLVINKILRSFLRLETGVVVNERVEARSKFSTFLGGKSPEIVVGLRQAGQVAQRMKVPYGTALLVIAFHEAGHALAHKKGLNHSNEVMAWELGHDLMEKSGVKIPEGVWNLLRKDALASYRKGEKGVLFPQWEEEVQDYLNTKPKRVLSGPPRRPIAA